MLAFSLAFLSLSPSLSLHFSVSPEAKRAISASFANRIFSLVFLLFLLSFFFEISNILYCSIRRVFKLTKTGESVVVRCLSFAFQDADMRFISIYLCMHPSQHI